MARNLNYLLLMLSCCLLGSVTVHAQASRDLRPAETGMANEGKTRALIIGISKYEYIDSLEYADRDAQVFADYLRNNAFWHVTNDDITLLVNDKARNGDLITQLARIARASNPGDNVLFYFSGHGDVETLTEFNNGYLLAYDTYTNNYIAGALPISFLKELFVTLLNKNVKVLLITDACRSGKLAGGIKGAQFAATAISNIWKNEIKILSSQPGQLSFESPKWGNGRGVFSYYLVKGLSGEADVNQDSSITLAELEMYVGNHVATETGNRQQPIFEGPNKYSTILAKLGPASKSPVKPAGNAFTKLIKNYHYSADTCQLLYAKMAEAINKENFVESDPESATSLYMRYKRCSTDSGLVLAANSQLLAALMNETQDIVNNSFIGKKKLSTGDFQKGRSLIKQILANNDLQLPYEGHLNNFRRYFLVMDSTSKETIPDNTTLDLLSRVMDTALKEEPDAAYLLTAQSRIEMSRKNWEKAIALQEESMQKSPGWLTPLYYLGMSYGNNKSYEKAIDAYEKVLKQDTLHQTVECTKCAFNNISQWAKELKMDDKSKEYFIKAMEFMPEIPEVPDVFENDFNFGAFDTGFGRNIRKQVELQLAGLPLPPAVMDSIRAQMGSGDGSDSAGYFFMMAVRFKDEPGAKDSAIAYLYKAVNADPEEEYYFGSLIDRLEEAGKSEEMQKLIVAKVKNYDSESQAGIKLRLANSYLKTGKQRQAFNVYKDLIAQGQYSCKALKKMEAKFSKVPEYKEFVNKCKDTEEGEKDD